MENAAFAFSSRMGEPVHEPFKSRFYVSYSSVVLLDIIPIGFQSQIFRCLFSLVPDLRVGVSEAGHKLFTAQGKVLYF